MLTFDKFMRRLLWRGGVAEVEDFNAGDSLSVSKADHNSMRFKKQIDFLWSGLFFLGLSLSKHTFFPLSFQLSPSF
jgi:hypothetical protein